MITLYKILEIYGINPATIKLVRHGNKEIQIYKEFRQNIERLETYQSFQNPNKFGNSKAIVVFAPYYKTTGIFLGMWDIQGCTATSDFTEETLNLLKKHNLP